MSGSVRRTSKDVPSYDGTPRSACDSSWNFSSMGFVCSDCVGISGSMKEMKIEGRKQLPYCLPMRLPNCYIMVQRR